MAISAEVPVNIESVRVPNVREKWTNLSPLAGSIRTEGLRRPITLWSDGTVISGARRHRAHLMFRTSLGDTIPAVFVHTIEDAAKSLLADSQDDHLAVPMKWSEVCRLWGEIRRLEAPAARLRAQEARRRGVELRRATQSGKRKPGRTTSHTEDYGLAVLASASGISEATAKRLWLIYRLAYGLLPAPDEKLERARTAMANIDAGIGSIWSNYSPLVQGRTIPAQFRPAPTMEAADPARQQAAWDRSLPQLEGLTAGLVELGPPNPALTWDQVGPVHDRLKAVRRDLEKIINKMREINKS